MAGCEISLNYGPLVGIYYCILQY